MKKLSRKNMTPNQLIIDKDITLYKTNSKASNFSLLSLVFECLYFLCVYGQQANNINAVFTESVFGSTSVYTYMMGISVILNLVILLGVFLASQELKNYNKNFSYFVWAVAVIQVVRIFIYPLTTYNTMLSTRKYIFGTSSLVFMIVWLVLSAICLAASGYFGFVGSVKREKFLKQIENKEVDLEAAYKEEDEVAVQEVEANA